MDWLLIVCLLYLGSRVSAINECKSCECCKSYRCQYHNGFLYACLDGCIDGYHGVSCRHACISNCLACEDANSCTKCRSGFYGAYCDMCPDDCSACSSKSNCNICRDGYYDVTCDKTCKRNCKTCEIYSGSCLTCFGGYYGHSCESLCPSFCMAGSNCSKSDGHCTVCADGFYYSNHHCNNSCNEHCKSCEILSWACIQCKDGMYGKHPHVYKWQKYLDCNSLCPKNCLNITCDGVSGNCNDGCVLGYWGVKCENSCPLNCEDGKCDVSNGKCLSGCKEGYTGSHCKCPINCNCDVNGICINCKDGYHNTFKNCTCRKDFCADPACTSCLNSTYYALSSACCQCGSTCKNRKCQSENKCMDGCIDGYHRDDCSGLCKDVDQYCTKCTADFILSTGKCLDCISGYYPHSTTNKCETCSEYCLDETCNLVNGTCQRGCKDGHWGDKCENICDRNCLRCNQRNGKCHVCINGKYLNDCSEDCSTNCYATNGLIMCAVEDGACLSGCDTPTKYGSHCEKNCSGRCENNTCNRKTGYCLNGCDDNFFGKQCNKACSVNCVSDIGDGRSCNDVDGDCIHGCKDGFHGDTCEKKCSENCVNTTCEKATGECVHGCRKRFSGSSCTEAPYTENTDDDESSSSDIGAFIGVGIGAAIATLFVVGMIVVVKRYTRCRHQEEDTREPPNVMTSISGRNDMSSAGVNIMEYQESDAVYENVSEYEELQDNTKDTSTYSHLVTATSSS